MEKQGSGHIVQITTSLVDHAMAGVPSVLASLTKGCLAAATKSLAIEYAKRGIRVNAVSPGVIKTPMHPVETHAQLGALHPVGHMGEISDIVDAILYLESASFDQEPSARAQQSGISGRRFGRRPHGVCHKAMRGKRLSARPHPPSFAAYLTDYAEFLAGGIGAPMICTVRR
jgi:NAD(P)-dependent dehydrogenase (short-subunit alcohol dehydrogenase family)